MKYAEQKGITCFNAAEGNAQAVAEHALGMLLSLFNNLNKADAEVMYKYIRNLQKDDYRLDKFWVNDPDFKTYNFQTLKAKCWTLCIGKIPF